MFGLFKRKDMEARFSALTPREKAVGEVRAHLEIATSVLTEAIEGFGIDCQHLAGPDKGVRGLIAQRMFEAIQYQESGVIDELRLGLTDDHESYDLIPHYRYREICYLILDMETARACDLERYRQLVTRHGPHALIQASLLSLFLLRMPVIEDHIKSGNINKTTEELKLFAQSITQLTAQLNHTFLQGLDLYAIRMGWAGWPVVFSVPVDDFNASKFT